LRQHLPPDFKFESMTRLAHQVMTRYAAICLVQRKS